jgi:DNA-binding transcriptional MerR regulator
MEWEETGNGQTQYTIKEASELTDVPPSTLRRWERELPGFLEPVRSAGRQRRYLEADLEKIRKLDYYIKHKGMTPAGAKLMIEDGVEPEGETDQELQDQIFGDKRVSDAIDTLFNLIRQKVLEEG